MKGAFRLDLPSPYNASTLLDRNLEAGRGGKVAIRSAEGDVTYEDLFGRVCAAARTLTDLGVRREDRVLLALDDSPLFAQTFLGAVRLGAVPVPVNPLLQRSEDYDHFFLDSLARVAVVDGSTSARVRPAAGRSGARVVGSEWSSDTSYLAPASTRPDDLAFFLYSSGSTGKPKAVVHLQHDIVHTCVTYAEQVLGITEDDLTFSTTKLFHAYGFGNNLTFPLWAGATAVLLAGRPTPPAVLETISRQQPTLFFSAPTLYNALLQSPAFDAAGLRSVRRCVSAAEPLPAEVWRRWKERTGLEILDGIGSTEMLHIYCSNRPEAIRPGSSGTPVPGYDLRIIGEGGSPVNPGESGELHVRGDSALALYWAQHDKTKRSLLGEWFVSGDRYRQDEDGYYWYEGRSDDMIKVSGLWVSPAEIEAALIEHAAVAECAAVGYLDADGLTRIRAFVVLREGVSADGDELREHCRGRLQRYQYPHDVRFVSDLPKTLTGKIQRFRLREGSGDAPASSGSGG